MNQVATIGRLRQKGLVKMGALGAYVPTSEGQNLLDELELLRQLAEAAAPGQGTGMTARPARRRGRKGTA